MTAQLVHGRSLLSNFYRSFQVHYEFFLKKQQVLLYHIKRHHKKGVRYLTVDKWLNRAYPIFSKDNTVSWVMEEKKNFPLSTVILKNDDDTLFGSVRSETIDSSPFDTVLKNISEAPSYYCYTTDFIEDAVLLLIESHDFVLPVVSAGMKLVGVITVFEILEAMMEFTSMDQPGARISMVLEDQPGALRKVVDALAEKEINISSIITSGSSDGLRNVIIRTQESAIGEIAVVLGENGIVFEAVTEEEGFGV